MYFIQTGVQKMIKKILLWAILFLLILPVISASYYELNIEYNFGVLTLNNISIKDTASVFMPNTGSYRAEMISLSNKTLNTTYFEINREYIYDEFDPETGGASGGDLQVLNQTNFTIYLPYYQDAKEINIYDLYNSNLLTIPVSQFSKNLCGDGTCQFYEDERSCPRDCLKAAPSNVTFQKPEVPVTQQITASVKENYPYYILGFVVLVVIIGIIVSFRKKPEQKSEQFY